MAYGPNETSKEAGRPIELFEFTVGLETYHYTNAEDDITYSANTYSSLVVMRTSPTLSSSENGRQQMEITLPADNVIAKRYIGIVPAERVAIRILRFHRGDSPNGVVLWSGRIVSAKFEKQGAVCRLYSVSSESALSRPCPGRKYQGLCNHKLGDGLCQVDLDALKITGEVLAVSGATVTVTGASAGGADWAVGGTVVWGEERRLVVAQAANTLTLRLPFPTSPIGQIVNVFPGCDHTPTTCEDKFSNIINFGGFPHVPTQNPFSTGLD